MRYSYEYKRKCVELYRHGKWSDCLPGTKNEKRFHEKIREWVRIEDANGPKALEHTGKCKNWTAEDMSWWPECWQENLFLL